jgi:hypothetical protein
MHRSAVFVSRRLRLWHRACNSRRREARPHGATRLSPHIHDTHAGTAAQEEIMFIRFQHVFITVMLVSASACDSPSEGPGPVPLPGRGYSSECGGYGVLSSALQPEGAYCDAELIQWSYDADAEMLTLLHSRFHANCCVERTAHAQLDGTEYQIVEVETALYGDTPCGCTCVFDLELSVPIPNQPGIELAVILDGQAAWNRGYETLWSDTIDLGAGAGEIVLSDKPSSWCDSMPAL